MVAIIERNPIRSVIVLIIAVVLLWLIFAVWPEALEDAIGRKKIFLNAILNGITLGALYFLVASGFTLIFGLMRNVNLAHGSLYLLGGYIGFEIARVDRLLGLELRRCVRCDRAGRRPAPIPGLPPHGRPGPAPDPGHDRHLDRARRSDALDLGRRLLPDPDARPGCRARSTTFFVTALKRSTGEPVYLTYPFVRLLILLASVVLGIAMWLVLTRTRIGMLIRAGVDDREMLSATGVRIQLVFLGVFAFGAGLAGMAGVVGGTFQSLAPGEDTRFLLASLVVVIVGGMGSIPGAALGAVLIGLAEQLGSVYSPTYAVVLTFLIMVLVLAFRPQGLLSVR